MVSSEDFSFSECLLRGVGTKDIETTIYHSKNYEPRLKRTKDGSIPTQDCFINTQQLSMLKQIVLCGATGINITQRGFWLVGTRKLPGYDWLILEDTRLGLDDFMGLEELGFIRKAPAGDVTYYPTHKAVDFIQAKFPDEQEYPRIREQAYQLLRTVADKNAYGFRLDSLELRVYINSSDNPMKFEPEQPSYIVEDIFGLYRDGFVGCLDEYYYLTTKAEALLSMTGKEWQP